MKLLISLLVVFLMIGFVASPVMACGPDGCQDGDGHDDGHDHGDDCDHEGDPADDQDDGGHGDCDGDSCHI